MPPVPETLSALPPPAISVLIRTFNSDRTLRAVLSSLQLQPSDEVIVVDSGSNDNTIHCAKEFGAHVLCLDTPFNYSRALNRGFEIAANEWVIALSSHCIPASPSFLQNWRATLEFMPADVAVAFGPRYLSAHDLRTQRVKEFYCRETGADPVPIHGGSSNGAYRKSVWREHPFQEQLRTGEDGEWAAWAIRNNYRVAFIPDVPVLYRNQGSLGYMFRKGFTEAQVAGSRRLSLVTALCEFGVNSASLGWKWLRGMIEFGTLYRQLAHRAGAALGGALFSPSSSQDHDSP